MHMKHGMVLVAAAFVAGCSSAPPLLRWEPTGGPVAQNVGAILVDEDSASTVYAGLVSGDVFRSRDEGRTWSAWGTVSKDAHIYKVVQHPEFRGRLFAATDSGLFTSSNRGKAWSRIPVTGEAVAGCRALTIDPFKTELMYAGMNGFGVCRSVDGGVTWTKGVLSEDLQTIEQADVYDIAVNPFQPDIVYAGCTGIGLVKSTDAGISWVKIREVTLHSGTNITAIAFSQKEPDHVCIGTDEGNILRSTDGGTTWLVSRASLSRDGIRALVGHPHDPWMLYAGTGGGLIVSPDFGTSWRPVAPFALPQCDASVAVAAKKPHPGLYAFGQGLGVQFSSDGGLTWRRADESLGGSTVSAIVTNETGSRLHCVVGRAVYSYNMLDKRWESSTNGLLGGAVTSIASLKGSDSVLYAGAENGVFRTIDGGGHWQPLSNSLRFNAIEFLDTHPWIQTRLLASTRREIMMSTDKGDTWIHTKPPDAKYVLRTLTYSPRDAGLALGATSREGIVVTEDGGSSWVNPYAQFRSDSVILLTLDPNSDRICYAWTSRGEGFRSTDRGRTWTLHLPPWSDGDMVKIDRDRYKPSDGIAVIGGIHLYHTSTGGESWAEVPVPPPPDAVRTVHWNATSAVLFAGTLHQGVLALSLKEWLRKERER